MVILTRAAQGSEARGVPTSTEATGPEVMQVPVLSLNLQSAAWLLGGEGEHVGEQLKALRTFHKQHKKSR